MFHILSGPSPQAVSKQLATEIIGLPVMPPFWSLGLHLCRENDNATVFQQTMEQMIKYGIGFDSDCIDGRLSGPGMGAIDTTKFPTADDDRRSLRVNDIKFLLSQPPHSIEQNVNGGDFQLVQCSQDTNDFLSGKRFNTSVFYPSYAAIDSEGGPVLQLDASVLLDPDGLSLVDNWPLDDASSSSSCSATDRPRPFIPDRLRTGNIITVGTLCMDAFHPNLGLDHVAVHNHYGIQQLSALSSGNPDIERRMLYLNRATALGNLGLAGYSGDDFSANWLSMRMALVQVIIIVSVLFEMDEHGPSANVRFLLFFFFFFFRFGMKPGISSHSLRLIYPPPFFLICLIQFVGDGDGSVWRPLVWSAHLWFH